MSVAKSESTQQANTKAPGSIWVGLLSAFLLGDRRNTLCRLAPIRTRLSQAWYWQFRWPLAYALWREMCSLPYRILATHERRLERGVYTGSWRTLADEGRIDHRGSPCRSADIRSLESLFPWVTLLDVEIFLLGRMVGEACQANTGHSCNKEHAELPRRFTLKKQQDLILGRAIRTSSAQGQSSPLP
jgi:hypothetical protein